MRNIDLYFYNHITHVRTVTVSSCTSHWSYLQEQKTTCDLALMVTQNREEIKESLHQTSVLRELSNHRLLPSFHTLPIPNTASDFVCVS